MKPLEIKGMAIGSGVPKTITSLMAPNVHGALEAAQEAIAAGVDCLEWRGDFCANKHDFDSMVHDARQLAASLPHNPLLFTFRSESQGGQCTLPVEEYVALNRVLIEDEFIDMVDIETWIGDKAVLDLVECAHAHGVAAVVSYHNFRGTPSVEWMVSLLTHMVDLGADIPKIATMATCPRDALNVLAATDEVARLHTERPLLTMAMGPTGSLTRVAGEMFGSALTFVAVQKASAPGQVDVAQAKRMMGDIHSTLA